VHPENELDPGIPGELSRFDAARAWPDAEPEAPPPGSYWVLAPGSAAESRRWPAGAFASLAREIVGETGWPGLIVGGPAEAPLAHELRADSSIRLLDFTARGPVSCYWRIFAGAKFTVANDSGLAHVASLCGSPTQVVWGGGDPKRTEPIGPGKVRIAFNPVDCWPCERNSCAQPPGLRLRCLAGIQPDAVWGEIKRGLRPA
jgi:ADP-heptose:LPS heptosyltransferase